MGRGNILKRCQPSEVHIVRDFFFGGGVELLHVVCQPFKCSHTCISYVP